MTTVIVGMSGGVDSSVAAYLLQQQGYRVEGLFMKNWEEDDTLTHCSALEDLKYAEAVCQTLKIPLHTANFAAEYWDNVFQHFLDEFQKGRTPNPDILCNKEIKFNVFLDYAKQLGADYIATGHYAKKVIATSDVELHKSFDINKDQTYFLHALNQFQLQSALFPLADYNKLKIRSIAKQLNLASFNKKDSTGICFIGERKFKDFLERYLPAQKGLIESIDGQRLGEHEGLMFYTVGQRQGLGIGGLRDAANEPWYVVDKDVLNNTLIVAQGAHHPALYAKALKATQLTWISQNQPGKQPWECTAKIRYRQVDQLCKVVVQDNIATVEFREKQRAITPGQSIVFYDQQICLGGGIIDQAIKDI